MNPDLALADYRRRVAELYLSDADLGGFRRRRDELFATHPQSPVAGRDVFAGLPYFDGDERFRARVRLEPADGELTLPSGDGDVTCRRVGHLGTPWGPLTLFWITGYGGGLFLPFRDGTAGAGPEHSYGAGRYLTDTIKGTHGRGLTIEADGSVTLDFNYAYPPSCAYSDRWACPLAPEENRLTPQIRAGERNLPTD